MTFKAKIISILALLCLCGCTAREAPVSSVEQAAVTIAAETEQTTVTTQAVTTTVTSPAETSSEAAVTTETTAAQTVLSSGQWTLDTENLYLKNAGEKESGLYIYETDEDGIKEGCEYSLSEDYLMCYPCAVVSRYDPADDSYEDRFYAVLEDRVTLIAFHRRSYDRGGTVTPAQEFVPTMLAREYAAWGCSILEKDREGVYYTDWFMIKDNVPYTAHVVHDYTGDFELPADVDYVPEEMQTDPYDLTFFRLYSNTDTVLATATEHFTVLEGETPDRKYLNIADSDEDSTAQPCGVTFDSYGTPTRFAEMEDIMGHTALVITNDAWDDSEYEMFDDHYYAVIDGQVTNIANSFGFRSDGGREAYSLDIDGDGTNELIVNNTFQGDGVQSAYMFSIRDGVPMERHFSVLVSGEDLWKAFSFYYPDSESVTVSWITIDGEESSEKVQVKDLDLDELDFYDIDEWGNDDEKE